MDEQFGHLKISFAQLLADAIEQSGLPVLEHAKYSPFSSDGYRRLLNEDICPSPENVLALSYYFGIDYQLLREKAILLDRRVFVKSVIKEHNWDKALLDFIPTTHVGTLDELLQQLPEELREKTLDDVYREESGNTTKFTGHFGDGFPLRNKRYFDDFSRRSKYDTFHLKLLLIKTAAKIALEPTHLQDFGRDRYETYRHPDMPRNGQFIVQPREGESQLRLSDDDEYLVMYPFPRDGRIENISTSSLLPPSVRQQKLGFNAMQLVLVNNSPANLWEVMYRGLITQHNAKKLKKQYLIMETTDEKEAHEAYQNELTQHPAELVWISSSPRYASFADYQKTFGRPVSPPRYLQDSDGVTVYGVRGIILYDGKTFFSGIDALIPAELCSSDDFILIETALPSLRGFASFTDALQETDSLIQHRSHWYLENNSGMLTQRPPTVKIRSPDQWDF